MASATKLEQNRAWIAKYRNTDVGKIRTAETNLRCWIKKAQQLLEKLQNIQKENE